MTRKDFLGLNFDEKMTFIRELNAEIGVYEDIACIVDFNENGIQDLLNSDSPIEIVRKTQFGDVNWNDGYIGLDGYNNLISYYDEAKIEEKLIYPNVDEIVEYINDVLNGGEYVTLRDKKTNETMDIVIYREVW